MAAIFAFGAVPNTMNILREMRNREPVGIHQVLLCGICVAAFLWFFLKTWSSNRHGRYVALTPTGVRARTPFESVLIPWNDVAGVSKSLGIPSLKRHGTRKAVELNHIFSGGVEVAHFETELGKALTRYAGNTDCTSHAAPDGPRPKVEQSSTKGGPT